MSTTYSNSCNVADIDCEGLMQVLKINHGASKCVFNVLWNDTTFPTLCSLYSEPFHFILSSWSNQPALAGHKFLLVSVTILLIVIDCLEIYSLKLWLLLCVRVRVTNAVVLH